MLLESIAAAPCCALAQQLEHGRVAREPSCNIHSVSGPTQGAALVPKTVGVRAVRSLRDKRQQGQGVSAAEEAIWVVCKGMKAGTGSVEGLVGTSLQTEWDAFAQSWA